MAYAAQVLHAEQQLAHDPSVVVYDCCSGINNMNEVLNDIGDDDEYDNMFRGISTILLMLTQRQYELFNGNL